MDVNSLNSKMLYVSLLSSRSADSLRRRNDVPGFFHCFRLLLFVPLLVLWSVGCGRATMSSGPVAEQGPAGSALGGLPTGVPSGKVALEPGSDDGSGRGIVERSGRGGRRRHVDEDEPSDLREQVFALRKELAAIKRRNNFLRGRLSEAERDLSNAHAEIENLRAKLAALLQPRPGQSKPPEIYEVDAGDTLSSIASRKDIYDDPAQWERIFEANKDIVQDPNSLRPGSKLVIPR